MKKLLILPAIILFFAGCSGDGIFYNLENEELIEDSNNFKDDTPVYQMLLFSDGGPNSYYIVNGKRIWYSLVDTEGKPWSAFLVPANYAGDATFPTIAVFNSKLYASVISHDANYRAGLVSATTQGGSWSEELYFIKEGEGKRNFYYTNMYLFSTSHGLYINKVRYYKNSDYEIEVNASDLYYYANGEPLTGSLDESKKVTFPGFTKSDGTIVPQRLRDIVYTGTETYLVYNKQGNNTNGVLCRATADPRNFSEVSTGLTAVNYTRLYYTSSGGGMVFLSTQANASKHPIYYKTGGSAWAEISGSSDRQYSCFEDISSMSGVSNTVLVGTRAFKDPTSSSSILGDGYFEINISDPSKPAIRENTFSSKNNYNSSDLNKATIMSIKYDQARDRLYTSTSSYGLWLNIYKDSSAQREWFKE